VGLSWSCSPEPGQWKILISSWLPFRYPRSLPESEWSNITDVSDVDVSEEKTGAQTHLSDTAGEEASPTQPVIDLVESRLMVTGAALPGAEV
jgi:hypothetical protein